MTEDEHNWKVGHLIQLILIAVAIFAALEAYLAGIDIAVEIYGKAAKPILLFILTGLLVLLGELIGKTMNEDE